MNILIACSEAVPYAKTGGLADVTGAVLKEFRKQRQKASLMLPLYRGIRERFNLLNTGKTIVVRMGDSAYKAAIWKKGRALFPEAYFIECDVLFDRPELYGTAEGDYPDNALRYIFFSRAVLEACIALDIRPDIIHCNDWQTGMVPLYLKTLYRRQRQFRTTATLLTVHNLGYQGIFDAGAMNYTGLGWDFFVPDRLEFFGKLNILKAGLLYADILNTVSTTYAKEILDPEYGFGLDGVLRSRKSDLYGIVNGIDPAEWDPAHDALLPAPYSLGNIQGKLACKKAFYATSGISDRSAPLIGIVSRLSHQKGLDLVLQAFDALVDLGAAVAVLGKGEEYYHTAFRRKAREHAGKAHVTIGFEETLAHQLYAAADFFLMPSRYEPCGIGQLIAMRFGAVPIARKTGGLADTIEDYDHLRRKGTGFLFQELTSSALLDSVKRAFCVYADAATMKCLAKNAMVQDFSWTSSARRYLDLYREAKRTSMP